MAAGQGFKDFTTGEVLTAADVDGYLMQGVWVFASAAARTSAVTSPQEGNASFLKDTNSLEIYDGAAWVAYGAGDITGVTAGTGISGGGTSGTVTITNSMATAIDAKGDLVVGTGADTFSRLAVGTNDYVLTAASGETTGLKWAAASGGNTQPAFRAYKDNNPGNQTITSSGTPTKISFDSEDFDTNNCFDSSTNYRFTPNVAGKYLIGAELAIIANPAAFFRMDIFKNGSEQSTLFFGTVTSTTTGVAGSALIDFNGTTDYVEIYVTNNGTTRVVEYGPTTTYFWGFYVRS